MPEDNDVERDLEGLSRTELKNKYPQEYQSWKNMKSRRRDGAVVHSSILDFGDFLRLIGQMPEPGMTLDRINPHDPEYSPDKCRWLTKAQQASNQRRTKVLTYKGQTKTITDWCREFDLKPDTVRRRFNKGGTPEWILFGTFGQQSQSPETWEHSTNAERWPWLGPKSADDWERDFRRRHEHLETRYEFFEDLFGKDLDDTRAGIANLEPLIAAYEAGKHQTLDVLEQRQGLDMTWDEIFNRFDELEDQLEVLMEVQAKFEKCRDTAGAIYHRPEPLRQK
ncbi:hypothetical protein Q4598_12420 [Phaeobacter inhibens]|nr:hypothetical protein [Phaeobacter inhibens]